MPPPRLFIEDMEMVIGNAAAISKKMEMVIGNAAAISKKIEMVVGNATTINWTPNVNAIP